MSKVTSTGSYWNNEGKYQEQYNAAWKALIPIEGEAEDGLPEALRAISRIGYDYYNNGFCNLWREWDDGDIEMDSYYEDMVDYLGRELPFHLFQDLKQFLYDAQGYGNWSDQAGIIDRIIDRIMEGIIKDGLLIETEAS